MVNEDNIAEANATYSGFMRGVKISSVLIGIATLIVVLLIASGGGKPA